MPRNRRGCHGRAWACLALLAAAAACHPAAAAAAFRQQPARSLLTGFSYGKELMGQQGGGGKAGDAASQQPRWQQYKSEAADEAAASPVAAAAATAAVAAANALPQRTPPARQQAGVQSFVALADGGEEAGGEEQPEPRQHHRGLLQQSAGPPALAPGTPITGVMGRPSNTTVYTIVNNNVAQYGSYVCIDSCAHANTCIWQNAWLWQCNGTNPTHHYWVWEPDTLIIRSATTDSFMQFPEICLDMCTDTRYGNGPCVVTAQYNVLNVGYRECTGEPNQQFELRGTQIVNKANGYCVSAGPQSCGRWGNCNKAQAQTGQANQILNVFAEPCDPNNINQQWTLGPAPNSTLIKFNPLNESAARFPDPVDNLAALASSNSNQVLNFVEEGGQGACLSIENQASCQSRLDRGGSAVTNTLSTVCVWKNALLTTCWPSGSDASADQQWVYDNSTKLLVLATDPRQNVCLELCSTVSFARGSCSLTQNNIQFTSCTGAPEQQWEFIDGLLYNEAADLCMTEQALCFVDYQLFLTDPSAINRDVDGFSLDTCLTNIRNGPWSGKPYNGTNGAQLGIRNLIGGPCDQIGNGTVRFTASPAASRTTLQDPIAPGITAGSAGPPGSQAASGGSNTGVVVGATVGAIAGVALLAAVLIAFVLARRRKAMRLLKQQQEEDLKKGIIRGQKLESIDSDVLAPARSGLWLDKLDVGDELNPDDIEIAKKPDGSDWKLGEGAFGAVYRANRFGVQPVAVKVLREDSSKQIENFKREIDMLRGLRDNNIVLFLGVAKKGGRLMLVTEFMPQGDLWNALSQANNTKFLWYYRGRKIALDVARGLVHLHQRGIVHMDLKSPNILLGKDLTAKIADVGLARGINTSTNSTMMTSIGTMAWAAPELKRNFKLGRSTGPRTLSAKADVFSFGVVIWEIVTGEDPTQSSREVRVPEECPADIEQLIQDCLEEDPDQRPDMKTVFERLKAAANVPMPGMSAPLATPGPTPAPTPPMSRDGSQRGSPPRSLRSGPLSNGRGPGALAAHLKQRFGAPRSGAPRTSTAPKSTVHADRIEEEPEQPEEEPTQMRERDDSAEEREFDGPTKPPVSK